MSQLGWRTVLVAVCFAAVACGEDAPGDAGAQCVPDDESRANFGGYALDEVNVGRQDAECAGQDCLVLHFQGRVTCPYGQGGPGGECKTSDGEQAVSVPVEAQLEGRRPSDSVYCTCKCAGQDDNANYCKCPRGFTCTPLIDDIGLEVGGEGAGSYCTKTGLDSPPTDSALCDKTKMSCG